MDLNALGLAFLAMVSVGGIAYVFLYPILSGDARAEKRQNAVAGISTERLSGGRNKEISRRDQVAQSLKDIEGREKARTKLTFEVRISQAGLTMPKSKFMMFSAIGGVLLGLLTYVITREPLFALAGIFVGALGIPFWFLGFLRSKRMNAFVNEFPNAMDVIVRGVKAGLPIGDCLRIIANEAAEPVRSEFKHIIETQQLGVPMSEAVGKMFDRMPVAEANFFGIVLVVQQKAGGNLAEALSNLSRVLRERKKMKGKITAMSMEAKASAAIIASLPVVVGAMLSVSTPRYIELLWITDAGKLAMAISAFWMFVGVMLMRKMINFDF
jgi:tight adherence protein B